MRLSEIVYPETPAGKRRIKMNVWGNINGYVGNKRFWEFGVNNPTNWRDAEKWAAGASLEEALN